MSLFGYDHAMDLLRARLMLTGDGGMTSVEDKGRIDTIVHLPGAAYYARLIRAEDRQVAKVYFPSGRGLAAPMDITDPEQFADLLHNADCSIKARRAQFIVPSELFSVADRMVHLRRQGGPEAPVLPMGDIKRSIRTGMWEPTPAVSKVMETLALASDPVMSDLSKNLIAVRNGKPSAAFDEEKSKERWLDQAGAWICEERGVEPDVIEYDGFRWSEIANHSSMAAASRRIGRLDGFVASSGQQMAAEDVAGVLRKLLRGDPKQKDWPQRAIYELTDPEGRTSALGIVDDLDIILINAREALTSSPVEAAKWLRAGLSAEPLRLGM